MKQIVMMQGLGNNEQGWARLVSKFGRVTMIQLSMIQHVEVWESGQRVFNGPETNSMSTRQLEQMTFSLPTFLRSLALFREHLRGQTVELIIASNYSMGLAALWLRWRGKTRRVVMLVSDYLPPRGSFLVRLHRRITTALTRFVARRVDEVWAFSPRIPTAQANPNNFVVPICLNSSPVLPGPREEIGYIGFATPDHGLEILFEIARRHGFRLNIIGPSPYLETIRHLAPPGTVFHGFLNEAKVNAVLSRCFCGYAVYLKTGPESYSYYGIPGKTFMHFASNTPVVTTNTAHFTANIEKYGVGRVVEPNAPEIEKAILQIKEQFPQFYDAIPKFRQLWNESSEQFHRERLSKLGII